MTYSLTLGQSIARSDGASIPPDPDNTDYQAYLAWLAAGNTPDPCPLPVVQAQQLGQLVAAYQAAILQPISFMSASGIAKQYQADPQSVSNLQNTLLGLSGLQATPTGFYWVALDNSQVAFTYADLQGLAAVMMNQGWVAFQHLQQRKAAVLAATAAADVQAVIW